MAAAHMQQFTQKRTTVIEKVNKKTRKIKSNKRMMVAGMKRETDNSSKNRNDSKTKPKGGTA